MTVNKNIQFRDGHFDIIFSSNVFHHIFLDNHLNIIRELRRVLNHNGILMIYEHNPFNPFTRWVVKGCPFDHDAVLIQKSRMEKIIVKSNLKLLHGEYRVFFPALLNQFRIIEKYLTWLPMGAQYFAVGMKE